MTDLARKLTSLVLLIASGLTSFGWWGVYTQAGMRAFEEMDGLIPFYAGVLGVIGLCAIALFLLFRRTRS